MSNKLLPLRGMKDLMPDDFCLHDHIKNISKNIGSLYGFTEVATPILEYTEVFDRTLGDTSDVISKEIYSFLDRKGRSIALRPEFTAGVMRAFISNSCNNNLPFKAFSYGPVFRYDRPQEGRQRQFYQINFEHIGADGAFADAEIIKLASHILAELGLVDITLELGSLGCTESRVKYQEALVQYFSAYYDQLSADSQRRLQKNPLRILDSKEEGDKKIVKDAPIIANYYTNQASDYFDQVKEYLSILGVQYKVNPRLVRGLDYYSHTAFEFTTDRLGAQGTVLAGGRYDGLCKLMGGEPTPAIGFAAGIERIAMLLDFKKIVPKLSFIIPIGPEVEEYAINLSTLLRQQGISVMIDFNGKIGKRVQRAISSFAQFIIFVGADELSNGKYKVKNLELQEEKLVTLDELVYILTS